MNSELFFEGKKYISSKRAAEIGRYTQDYIGQLIRDKKIEARRVGRAWFVSLSSLEKHIGKKNGESTFSEPAVAAPTQAKEEQKPLYLEGKKFVSSKEASELSGYSRDYIGQLVRDKRIDATMVGRSWFVSLPSLEEHIEKQKGEKLLETEKKESPLISRYEKESILPIPHLPKKDTTPATVFERKISYPVLVVKRAPVSPFAYFKKMGLAAAIVMVLLFGASTVHLTLTKNALPAGTLASASLVSKVGFESFAIDWYRYVNGKFIGVHRFFAELFGTSHLAVETRPLAPASNTTPQGLVVMPSTPENNQAIEHIKQSFSDNVGVKENADGISGVITPVFQKVSGDEYLYVLVPVQEKKQ